MTKNTEKKIAKSIYVALAVLYFTVVGGLVEIGCMLGIHVLLPTIPFNVYLAILLPVLFVGLTVVVGGAYFAKVLLYKILCKIG